MSEQALFAAGLLVRDVAVPAGVTDPRGRSDARRFRVYRNNASSALVQALADNFPLSRSLVGEDFFDAMADVYHRASPPASPILFRYGEGFADFATGFEPARDVPYLPDLMRLEHAWLQSFHAADAMPVAFDALGAFAPEALMRLRFTLHPAMRVIRSRWPLVSLAAALRADDDLSGIDFAAAEDALVTRPDTEVELRDLPPGGAVFILALLSGATLGEAAEEATGEGDFDLAMNIGGLFQTGIVTDLEDHP